MSHLPLPTESTVSEYVLLRSKRELKKLAEEILGPERDYPIVCLTARSGEKGPALDAEVVRRVMGPGIPIYFVSGLRTYFFLSSMLPKGLGVWRGATRVWWPGVRTESDPREHPLICDRGRHARAKTPQSLTDEFLMAEHPRLTTERRLVLAERQRSAAQYRVNHLERHLRRVCHERGKLIGKSRLLESRLQLSSKLLRSFAERTPAASAHVES